MARFKTTRQRDALVFENCGKQFCSFDFGGDAPAPDPLIGQSAVMNAEIAREYLDWTKQKDADLAPARQEATQLALAQARTQNETSAKQNAMADETYAYTKGTFRPLEQKIAADALGYDTPERRNAEAAQIQADIGTAGDAQSANMARDAASRGVDVNSGNFLASQAGLGAGLTAAKAGAGNQARKNVEAIGAAKLSDAAALGRGIASTNATQTQLGLNAGNSAVNNAQVPGNIASQQGNMMAQGAGTAIQGNSSAGNLMLGQYNAQNTANNSNNGVIGALGNIAGQFAGSKAGSTAIASLFSSDKNVKKDRKRVSPNASLAAVRKMPVDSWKYKKGSVADVGGKTHVGPMAQDVKRSMGEKAAPGGKMIDLVTLNGHTLNAIKSLDKRLARLEKR